MSDLLPLKGVRWLWSRFLFLHNLLGSGLPDRWRWGPGRDRGCWWWWCLHLLHGGRPQQTDEDPHPLVIAQKDLHKLHNQIHLQRRFSHKKQLQLHTRCSTYTVSGPEMCPVKWEVLLN